MKRFVFLLLFLGTSLSGIAQEKYFHELKGMEDSTGTTQLFYRLFESRIATCSYYEYPSTMELHTNHIYKFDFHSENDSIYFEDSRTSTVDCTYWSKRVLNFEPISEINEEFGFARIEINGGGLSVWQPLIIPEIANFDVGLGNISGLSLDKYLNRLVVTTPIYESVVKTTESKFGQFSFYMNLEDSSSYNEVSTFDELPDSLFFDFMIIGINPFKRGHYIGLTSDSLVISTDHGNTYTAIFPNDIYNENSSDSNFNTTLFDADSTTFYIYGFSGIYKGRNETNGWVVSELLPDFNYDNFTIDKTRSGHVYISDSLHIYFSDDYGESLNTIYSGNDLINGLYKKPNSPILYILTPNELLELNTETLETTILKTLPVSNESNPELPTTVKLHQNYPNPFNPSTIIPFELDKSTQVKLTVYDVLGREISVLLNEHRPAGYQEVTLNASGFSSGIYFYELSTPDIGLKTVQKMLLIK